MATRISLNNYILIPVSYTHLIRAYNILKNINVIAGYTTYVDLVKDEFPDKEFLVSGMKREIERCREVLEVAKTGKDVALISSGDAGIYGMAGIMLEVAMGSGIEIEVDVYKRQSCR